MRLFLIILILILIGIQTPFAKKYVDTYFNKASRFTHRLMDTEDKTAPVATQYPARRTSESNSSSQQRSFGYDPNSSSSSPSYSQDPFKTNYKGQTSTLSGTSRGY